jgi:hypothetical protein
MTAGSDVPQGRAHQAVDLAARRGIRHTLLQFQLNETDEQRIQRATGGENLLGNIGEWPPLRDHGCHG